MDRFDLEDVVAPPDQVAETPLKEWRLKYQAGTSDFSDFIDFFRKESRKYFEFQYEYDTGECLLSYLMLLHGNCLIF